MEDYFVMYVILVEPYLSEMKEGLSDSANKNPSYPKIGPSRSHQNGRTYVYLEDKGYLGKSECLEPNIVELYKLPEAVLLHIRGCCN